MKKKTTPARATPGFVELNAPDPRATDTGPKEATKNISVTLPVRLHTAMMIERSISKKTASAILVEALEARYGIGTNEITPAALAAARAQLADAAALADMHARFDDPEAEAEAAKRFTEDPLIP